MTDEPIIEGVGLNLTDMSPGRTDLLPEILARYRAIGCSHVELTARRLDFVVAGRLNVARAEAVGEIVAEAGLVPVLHANHAINLMDPDAEDLHEAAAAASIAACARLAPALWYCIRACCPPICTQQRALPAARPSVTGCAASVIWPGRPACGWRSRT